MESSEDEDDLSFLSAVLNKRDLSSSPFLKESDKRDDIRYFSKVREDVEMGHSVGRLKKRVEHMDAKKEELEKVVKELKYVNGYLSKELEEMKEKEKSNEEKITHLSSTIRSGRSALRLMNNPLQDFRAFLEYSFSSISVAPNSQHVPPTLAKLRSIYTDFEKLIGDTTVALESTPDIKESDLKVPTNPPTPSPTPSPAPIPSSTPTPTPLRSSMKPHSSRLSSSSSSSSSTRTNKSKSTNGKHVTHAPTENTKAKQTPHHLPPPSAHSHPNLLPHVQSDPSSSISSQSHLLSVLEVENAQLKQEIKEVKDREEFLNASIPHYRMAVLKLKAHVKALQDQVEQTTNEKRHATDELRMLQDGIQESEAEKLSAYQKLAQMEEEYATICNKFNSLQYKYTANDSLLEKLQETNQALKVALEKQLQKNMELQEKDIKTQQEYDDTEWEEAHRVSPDHRFPSPPLNYSPSINHNPPFHQYLKAQPSYQPNPESHQFSKFTPTSTTKPNSATLSSAPLAPSSSPTFIPSPTHTVHLRRELNTLDAEIEHLQSSLKRQLSELSSPH